MTIAGPARLTGKFSHPPGPRSRAASPDIQRVSGIDRAGEGREGLANLRSDAEGRRIRNGPSEPSAMTAQAGKPLAPQGLAG